jgi:SAM-dependent methyltransferase
MLRKIVGKGYKVGHRVLHTTLRYNPFVRKVVNHKPVGYGFISDEHLANPALDDRLIEDLKEAGIETGEYQIDIEGYRDYLRRAQYPRSYHGGGEVPGSNFPEKTLEHYVSAEILRFGPEDVFMDVASDRSPFHDVVRRLWHPKQVYRQDLGYKRGIHGDQIGGSAGEIPLPDNSISMATLHCSLEHFEGDSDIAMFREMGRVLMPGGRLCILPFYLAHEYTIHTDPIHTLFFARDVAFDPEAHVRYCSWTNRHSRHYDVAHVKRRILPNLNGLKPKVYRVTNFKEADPSCYLRFIGLFEKPLLPGGIGLA